MRRLILLLRLRFGEPAMMLGGLLLGTLFAGVVLSLFFQIGPDESGRDGVVVAMGRLDSEGGSRPTAVVRLPSGETYTVGRRRGEDCRIGDKVTVYFYPTVWGRWLRSGACRR